MSELQQLAKLYRTSVNAVLRQEAVQVDPTPRFRKVVGTSDEAADYAAKLLGDLAKAEVELENLLGIKRVPNYPPERPILRGDVRVQAEHDAMELRQRLGLGNGPVADIVALLELELGVRVYVRRLNSRISGLFAYDDALGPCILLNASHPRDRRTQCQQRTRPAISSRPGESPKSSTATRPRTRARNVMQTPSRVPS